MGNAKGKVNNPTLEKYLFPQQDLPKSYISI
jgi:hypothetical protein